MEGLQISVCPGEKRLISFCAVDLDKHSMTRQLLWIFLISCNIANATSYILSTMPFGLSAAKLHNHGESTCRLFHHLAQFLFTTSETELYYY